MLAIRSNGWQESVRSAYAYGSAEVVTAVLAKNATDTEIFALCLRHFQAGAATGLGPILFRCGAISSISASFTEFFAAAKLPQCAAAVTAGLISAAGGIKAASPAAVAIAVVESMCRFLLYLAQLSRADAASSAELRACVLELVPLAPVPSVKRMIAQVLCLLAKAPAVLNALSSPAVLDTLMPALTEVFAPNAVVDADAAGGARMEHHHARPGQQRGAAALTASPGAAASAPGGSAAYSAAAWNGHVLPGLALFDAMSRTERGLGALRACAGTMTVLARAVEFAQAHLAEATGALGVRVLARVLGNDLARLFDRIAAAAATASTPSIAGDASVTALRFEAEFAAAVLASLALDAALAGRIVAEGFLERTVALLRDGAAGLKISASLCQVLRRVAGHAEEHLGSALAAGALEAVVDAVRRTAADGKDRLTGGPLVLVTEGLATCGDLVQEPAHVAVVDAPWPRAGASGVAGVAWVVDLLRRDGASDPSLAVACLHVINAVQVRAVHVSPGEGSSCGPGEAAHGEAALSPGFISTSRCRSAPRATPPRHSYGSSFHEAL